jgi:L-asparaginase
MTKPLVAVASLGGTISMSGPGVTPALGAADLLGELSLPVDVEPATVAAIPSASLDFATLGRCLGWARERVSQGAHGIVVVQGTDTLEETAYFFESVWPEAEPVVVTGAMRHPGMISPDGPANLAGAVTVAADPASRGRGALVVLNDEVHQARWAHKAHSSRLDAFSSAPAGPLGLLAEGAVHYFHPAGSRARALPVEPFEDSVPLLEAGLEDSGALLDTVVDAGAAGVVVAAGGVGHVSEAAAAAIERALERIPVVIASRTGVGTTFRETYGFRGSESDLVHSGAIMAGWLSPRKSRILLRLLLATGADRDRLHREFHLRGSV